MSQPEHGQNPPGGQPHGGETSRNGGEINRSGGKPTTMGRPSGLGATAEQRAEPSKPSCSGMAPPRASVWAAPPLRRAPKARSHSPPASAAVRRDSGWLLPNNPPQCCLDVWFRLIVQAIGAVFIGIVTVGMFQLSTSLESVSSEAELADAMGPFLAFMAGTLGVSVLIGFLGSVLQGVLVVPVSRSVLNRRTGFKQMWKLAGPGILPLLGVAALLTLGGLLVAAAVIGGVAILLFTAMGPAPCLSSCPWAWVPLWPSFGSA